MTDIHCVSATTVTELPGRLHDAVFHEIAAALELHDDDAFGALRQWATSADIDTLGPRLLELLLLRPPIPAGCTALVEQMEHGERPPWLEHGVVDDRSSVWVAHALLHQLLPERFAAPELAVRAFEASPAPNPTRLARPQQRLATAQAWLGSQLWPDPSAQGKIANEVWHTDVDSGFGPTRLVVWGPQGGALSPIAKGARWQIAD